MKLGLNLGYWTADNGPTQLALAQRAEQLGYRCVWVAEAYGSDAPTILSWIAAHTSSIGIGSAIMQIPARTPAMTAMTAVTLDTLSQGRFHLGLGVSGPQVSEGWHGIRFAKPLERTREYVEIVKQVISGDRVQYAGEHYQLPLLGGQGKPVKLTFERFRAHIPLYIASLGPKNVELTGEIADGWLGVLASPETIKSQCKTVAQGRAKAGKTLAGFDIAPTIATVYDPDWHTAAAATRGYSALYVGGMGSKSHNFYNRHFTELGYGDLAREVQEKYLARDYAGAAAAFPDTVLDEIALLGPPERMAEKLAAYAEAGVSTLNVSLMPGTDHNASLDAAAQALKLAGL